jgi:hypothetical protein
MALRKFSIKISVFLTSDEYTSDPTIGQKGTFGPNSCDTARANAVLPVPEELEIIRNENFTWCTSKKQSTTSHFF